MTNEQEPVDGFGFSLQLTKNIVFEMEFSMAMWGLGIVTVFRDIWLVDVFFLFMRVCLRSGNVIDGVEDANI